MVSAAPISKARTIVEFGPGTGVVTPAGIAVDATSVYFTSDTGAGAVLLVPLAGAAMPVTLVSGQGYASAVVAFGPNVYWLDQSSSGSVMQVAK